jgi:hypothetical protein
MIMEQFDVLILVCAGIRICLLINPQMDKWGCMEVYMVSLGEEEQHSCFHLLALIFHDLG